jgi:hypothetical protein
MNGDGEIVARVTSVQNTSPFAKAGIMLRESLDAAAANVILDERPDGSIEFMVRSTAGASTAFLGTYTAPVPVWLRLQRSGPTVTSAVSLDGTNWTEIGSVAISLPTVAYAGLAVTSTDNTQLNTSTFDNLTVP